jgi:2Fe-2S ferredoxin
MPRVTFLHSDGRSGEVEENISLLDAAKEVGFRLNHDCGGNASCTTCRVEVQMGHEHLSEVDFDEQDLLDREALASPCVSGTCLGRCRGTRAGSQMGESNDNNHGSMGLIFEREVLD